MRSLRREPALLLALLAVIALVLAFIVYPQVQVVVAPGPGGYVSFLEGGTWTGPLVHSLEVMALSTTTAVLLGFVYAYAMVYSEMRWKPFFRLIGILQLVGGQFTVLPTQAYNLISGFGEFTSAAAVSTLLLLIALALYVAKIRLDGGRSFVTISGRASSMPRPPVPAALSWACFAGCLLLAGLILMIYGTLLVSAITVLFPINLTPTARHFTFVATGSNADALRNTLVFSGVAALVSAILALFAGWIVQRGDWPGKGILDFLFILPAAIPGIFFGIGYLTAFNQPWLDWVDRGWLIILSMAIWNIPR